MHNKHKGLTSMPSAGFQTAIPAMDAYADLRLRRQGQRGRLQHVFSPPNTTPDSRVNTRNTRTSVMCSPVAYPTSNGLLIRRLTINTCDSQRGVSNFKFCCLIGPLLSMPCTPYLTEFGPLLSMPCTPYLTEFGPLLSMPCTPYLTEYAATNVKD